MHVLLFGKRNHQADDCVVLVKPWNDVGLDAKGRPNIPLPCDNVGPPEWWRPDGTRRTYAVTFFDGEAFVPTKLGGHMIRQGLVRRGADPDPKPSFARQHGVPTAVGASAATAGQSGVSHGAAIGPWARWVREATAEEIETAAAAYKEA
jgi:hypothetical protein